MGNGTSSTVHRTKGSGNHSYGYGSGDMIDEFALMTGAQP
jgi:hypothetical protein